MSRSPRTATGSRERRGSILTRLVRAWRSLSRDRRLAAVAAFGLCLTLFLPWYQETGFASGKGVQSTAVSLTGWHAFSWVEAALLLVAAGVLALLFLRAEGRAFHLPGGDGFIVTVAGVWTCALLIWRIFDKQGSTHHGQFGTTFGIKWGILAALGFACLLAYAGTRIRAAHQPEPPLPGEEDAFGWDTNPPAAPSRSARPRRPGGAGLVPAAAQAAPAGAPAPARQSRAARRALWAEPVAWEGPADPADPQLAFRATAPASRGAAAAQPLDESTQPLGPADLPTKAHEAADPVQAAPDGDAGDDPTVPRQPHLRLVDDTAATWPLDDEATATWPLQDDTAATWPLDGRGDPTGDPTGEREPTAALEPPRDDATKELGHVSARSTPAPQSSSRARRPAASRQLHIPLDDDGKT
jgi:hypothetical protein